jgi:hypothetical protein
MKTFPRSVVSAVLAVLFSTSIACAGKVDIPLPGEVTAARDLLQRVERSKSLPDEAKQQVRENHAAVQAQFDQLWSPLVSLVDARITAHETITAELAQIEEQIRIHNEQGQYVPRDNYQAVEDYNREGEALNGRGQETLERGRRTLAQYDAQIQNDVTGVQSWLAGPSLARYTAVAEGLLSGRIVFRQGRAWNDLQNAARSQGLLREPYDTPNTDPNVVDLRP